MLTTPQSFKQIRFGANATILTARSEPITLDAIASLAPAVLATEKHDSRSARYQFIDTRAVLQGLLDEGFSIFEVRQGGSRVAGKREFTKHMLRLRYAGETGKAITVRGRDSIIPEIVLTNAHDGTASYQMGAGCFRIICTNGLVAGELFEYVRVPHKGDVQHQVIDAAFSVVSQFPMIGQGAERMASVELSRGEQRAFAMAAAQLRWDGQDEAPVEPERLLQARRTDDQGADLWRTMNRTQENVIRGGIGYTLRRADEAGRVRTSHRHTGEVRGIDQNNALNRALWTLAEEMEKLKAA